MQAIQDSIRADTIDSLRKTIARVGHELEPEILTMMWSRIYHYDKEKALTDKGIVELILIKGSPYWRYQLGTRKRHFAVTNYGFYMAKQLALKAQKKGMGYQPKKKSVTA